MRCFLALFLLTVSLPLWAQNRVAQLPEVLVSASRIPKDTFDVARYTSNYSTISSEEIKRSGKNTITEVLQNAAGITVQDTSGFALGNGLGPVVNFRGVGGFSKSSTLVLLNGVKLNQMADNAVFWRAIPVQDIERIEILKGGSSGIIYGEGALSGVIHIITKKFSKEPSFTLSKVIGSFKQQEHSLSYSQTYDNLAVRGYLSQDKLGGYRGHSNHHGKRASVHLDYAINDNTSLNTYALSYESSTEFSDALTPQEIEQDRRQEKNPGKYHNRIVQVQSTLTHHLSNNSRIDNALYLRKKGNDSKWFNSPRTIDQSGRGWQGTYSLHNIGPAKGSLTAGTSIDFDQLDDQSPFSEHESALSKYSLFARYNFKPKPQFVFESGLRFDRAVYDSDLKGFTSFRGKLNYHGFTSSLGVKIHSSSRTTWFANIGQAFKIPPPFAVISTNINQGKSNFNLDPEKAIHFEMGISAQPHPKLNLKASMYALNINDEIFFDSISFKNKNFDTHRHGFECETAFQVTPQLKLGLNSNISTSKFRNGDYSENPLPLNPKHTHSLYAHYQINKRWNVHLDSLFVYDQIRGNDFQGRLKVDDYHVLNLKLGYTNKDFTFFIRLNNLLNEKYSTSQGSNGVTIVDKNTENPMPAFGIIAGLKYTF